MARTIICPVGLSIFQGKRGLSRLGVTLTPGHELQQAREVIADLGPKADELSAELATLKRMDAGREDTAVFLATDTDDGERAAWVNAALAAKRFGVADPVVKRIKGLVLDNATRFRTVGIRQLIEEMEAHVGRALATGWEPVLSVSGGIKPVVPYVAVYGMLRGLPITYAFEVTGELITLPPLPIGFDWATLALAERVLGEIERETTIDRTRLETLLGDDWRRLQGLFEEVDGQASVSALGHMVLDIRRRGVAQPVMLSPSARSRLDQLRGTERKAVEGMLDRVRNPLIRAHKIHSFHGTDLDVYKPGDTGLRLAYWVEGDCVYVAEIYAAHDDYERHLPGRVKKDYQREEFVAHWPDSTLSPADDPLSDETVIVALRDVARAEQERDQAKAAAAHASQERELALALAAEVEEKYNALRESVQATQERLAGLEGALRDMRSWRLWRRLRWAVFGGGLGPADLS
jgi:putative CRISPR-associated protein (TIGR02619 family)